ncbi:8168_t:CDS:2 [Diversispora eburnea]|uniref:8168_t:CDS:1 n=1 Tax=Diversispora eburnea TaxID=1213867 RepID=A0A9N8VJW1_9GLOM|nr:8168_t:CDS:2 [Diversispora eburnea]
MATKISIELLIMILNNVQSTQDLYSTLLVNRLWCKVTIPILWELPFGQDCKDNLNLRKKALCIRTYISPQQINFPYHDDNNSRVLFREICTLIVNRSSSLDYFKLARVPVHYSRIFNNYVDLIGSILNLPGAPKVFKKLEIFASMIRDDDDQRINPLYESLAIICNNILNMDLKINSYSYSRLQLIAKLISAQKRLENLSIVDNCSLGHDEYGSILWAIISQKETLKSLRLKDMAFYYFKRKSSPIGQFSSLQELYIEDCCGLDEPDSLFFASSFTQLNIFHLRLNFKMCSQEFIIKILETANTNLRNICLDLDSTIPFDTFSTILNYCTKINELALPNLSLEQVIAIFNNNFNELRRFSFNYREGFDANKLLCQMAKNVPESLETIEIKIDIFSAYSLRKFFEGWCCKGGGGNKKIIVKRKKQARPLSGEHFKVIEEYGVQFDIEEYSK